MKRSIALIVAYMFFLASSAWAVEEIRPLGMASATGGYSGDLRVGNTCTTSPLGKYYCGLNTRHIYFFSDNTVDVDHLYPLASADTGFPYVSGGTWTIDSLSTYRGRLGTGTKDNTTYLRGDGTWAVPPGGGTGDGDMLQATYDANTDNVVDSAIATAIEDDLIVDADINSSANISGSKIADNTVTPAILYSTGGTADNTTWYRGDGYWAAISATPGGSDGAIQFNMDGVFGAVSGAGYDNVANTIALPALTVPSVTATQTASAGCVKLFEPSGGGSSMTGFCAPALADNVLYTLPTADGSDGNLLKTNGSKVLSWVAAGTATNIPTSAAPTVDAAGEIAQDTSADQIVHYGAAVRVIDYRRTENATFKSPVSGDKAKFRKPYGMTVTSVGCVTDAATSAILDVQECNANGASCATILTSTITCGTTYICRAASGCASTLSDYSVAAANYVFFSIGTVTGTVGYVYVDFNYSVTRE